MALLLIVSFVATLLPIVLYTGALNIESIFEISNLLDVDKRTGLWITILTIGIIGSIYAIYGGLRMVAYTDTINGYGLLVAGCLVPLIALYSIGDGNIIGGLVKVFNHAPEKFNVVSKEASIGPGSRDAILPFSVLFTGMIINQLYFWTMHQSIIQRVLGAVSLKEAQKGLLLTGVLKILIPIIIILPGIIGFYYFGEQYYGESDLIYPVLVKKVLPFWLTGIFVAIVMGAVLSTFNSALNSAATIFSLGLYKRYWNKSVSDTGIVRVGRLVSLTLAVFAIGVAPFVANAPSGLYQLLQQLNGIFFIPMATVILAAFLFPKVSAIGAKAGLVFGLLFYVIMNFVFKVEMHFVHLWGIEFILNLVVMHMVSMVYPRENSFVMSDSGAVQLVPWKYTKFVSSVLIFITIVILSLIHI